DGQVRILKGDSAPSLAIQFTGVKPARVEIKVNGESLGAKKMDGVATKGVVPFKIDPAKLGEGDNVVEAFLYDKNGNIIGHEKTILTIRKGSQEPVFVKMPKMGHTVQGTVAIESGFGMKMEDAYVSFFVDNEFRAMKNFPPFSFLWDTTQETNGWHQLEAWSFDRSQITRKSTAVRVFVNNPGGRTERVEPAPAKAAPAPAKATPKPAPAKAAPVNAAPKPAPSKAEPVKPAPMPAPVKAAPAKATPAPVKATPIAIPILSDPTLRPLVGGLMGMRAPVLVYTEVGGFRVTTPKAPVAPKPVPVKATPAPAKAAPAKVTPASAKAAPTTAKVAIEKGTRLPNAGAYAISLGGKKVDFDVAPRVEGGVPLTPFRHLFEAAGGEVDWDTFNKICTANGLGHEVVIKIGDLYAKVNGKTFQLEVASFIEKGRTIVPLSFVSEALNFDISYDRATNHVLILKKD
ncbi:MAG: stalk domain-containing protein, partial [Armatimonadota bacterium]|nr:stalk domain-containing protein [Armatimonadota bacterium]